MANVDHGTILPTNGPGNNRGNHPIQGLGDGTNDHFANEAAREAFTVLSADIGSVARQLDTNRWYIAIAAGAGAASWQLIGSGGASGGSIVLGWNWLTDIVDNDPGSGNMKGDNATQSSITQLNINDITVNGKNVTVVLESIHPDDVLIVTETSDSTRFIIFEANGIAVDQTTYWEVPGVVSQASASPIRNNRECAVQILFASMSPLTTKGDLFTYDTADARLPVGDDGFSPVADSTEALGLTYLPANTVSGVLTGCVVTINGGDAALFDVSSGTFIIWDWTGGTPVATLGTFAGVTGATVTDIGTTLFTSLFINTSAAIEQFQDANPTATQRRELVSIQSIAHAGSTISSVSGSSQPAYDVAQSLIDYVRALGPVNSGNLYDAATLLTVTKGAGTTTLPFINRDNDTQNPSEASNASVPTADIRYSFRDGAGGFTFAVSTVTDVDVGNFDDDSGTPAAVSPTSRFTIQRGYFFGQTNSTVFTYGQVLYNSIAEAESSIFTENPEVSPQLDGATFTTALIVQANTTDLNTAADAKFVAINLGAVSAGGTGAVTSVASIAATLLTATPTIGDVVLDVINQEIDTVDDNVFYGNSAGNEGVHSGINNAGFGPLALRDLTTGSSNSGLGRSALQNITDGQDNSGLGLATLLLIEGGDKNTAVGAQAVSSLITGSQVTGVGFDTLRFFTASAATAIGASALVNATAGTGLVAIGLNALSVARTANAATAIGSGAFTLATGANLTGLGTDVGSLTTSGANLILIGHGVEASAAAASDELNIGDVFFADLATPKFRVGGSGAVAGQADLQVVGSGADDTTAVFNISNVATATNGANIRFLVGDRDPSGVISQVAGAVYFRRTAADSNSAVYVNTSVTTGTSWADLTASPVASVTSGDSDIILVSPTTGAVVVTATNQEIDTSGDNVFYGEGTGNVGVHSGAVDNVGIGTNALSSLTTGDGNTAVGVRALNATLTTLTSTAVGFQALLLATGGRNTALGANAGQSVVAATDTVFVGNDAGIVNTASQSTAVGSQALAANTSGLRNTAVGFDALNDIVTGDDSTAVGYQTLATATGLGNTAVGANAGSSVTAGNNVTLIGANAGKVNTASNSIGVGADALLLNTSGVRNVAIGKSALAAVATTNRNTAVGFNALLSATGASNTAVGSNAGGAAVVSSDHCTFIGSTAGLANTAAEITSVGSASLAANTSGVGNTAVGFEALNDITTNGLCTAVGHMALDKATGGGNTALGFDAGGVVTTGANNTHLGQGAGIGVTTVNGTIIIGQGIGGINTANHINIGDTIFGNSGNNIERVRIGGSGAVDAIGEGTLQVESVRADTDAVMRLEQTGSNGALSRTHVGARNPSGTITANPGTIYVRVSGVNSGVFINTGSGSGTTWTQL